MKTFNPVFVVAVAIKSLTISTVSKITPFYLLLQRGEMSNRCWVLATFGDLGWGKAEGFYAEGEK